MLRLQLLARQRHPAMSDGGPLLRLRDAAEVERLRSLTLFKTSASHSSAGSRALCLRLRVPKFARGKYRQATILLNDGQRARRSFLRASE